MMKKVLKITGIVAGSLVAFILLVFILVTLFGGCIAKNYVNKHSHELIGRAASIEHVRVNLFTGRVAINGLSVMEDNAKDQFAGFDTLDVSVSLPRLLGKTLYVRHITLAGLNVQVLQDSNKFNFTSLIDHFKKDSVEEEEEEDTTSSGMVISLHNIRLSDGKVYYADLPRGSHIGLNNMNLMVPDFVFGGKDNTDAGLTVSLADGGELKVDGELHPDDNNFDATVRLTNFALDQVRAYITDKAYIDKIAGRLNVDAKASGNLNHIMDMEVAAKASIDDVNVLDREQSSVASLKSLKVDLAKLVLSENLFDVRSVTMDGLTAAYEVFADSTNTLSRLLVSKGENNDTASVEESVDTTPAKPMHLHVGKLLLENINLTYTDHTLPDDFVFPVTNLRVEADNVSTSGDNSARIFANLPHGGVALIDWKGNISDWKSEQALRLNIKNLHLGDLSPYMVAFFGMPFTDGVFSFTSFNTIHNSQLEGKNRIDIFKPTLGDKRKDVSAKLHLPVKAALYILKDKDDKIVLDVPVKGNIDSPEFDYMKLVWKTLGNLVVKVATSPARVLGNMFGGNGNDDEVFIAIDTTEHGFTSEQFYQIDKLAEMAKGDDNISLNFLMQTAVADTTAMRASTARRNAILRRHLAEMGLKPTQYSIGSASSDDVKRNGYSVTTSIVE